MANRSIIPATTRFSEVAPGPIGYGADAMPTVALTTSHVTTLANSGAGSLRSFVEDSTARNIVFDVNGTISLSSFIHMQFGNKIIDGRGANITISGGGIVIGYQGSPGTNPTVQHVIIRNLKFTDITASNVEIG